MELSVKDIKIKEQDFVRGKRTVIKLYNAFKLLEIIRSDRTLKNLEKPPENMASLGEREEVAQVSITSLHNRGDISFIPRAWKEHTPGFLGKFI